MKEYKGEKIMMKEKKNEGNVGSFEIPKCEFRYDRCSTCRWYNEVNGNGFCDYHRRRAYFNDIVCWLTDVY